MTHVYIGIRIAAELKDKLRQMAKQAGISRNQIIAHLVENATITDGGVIRSSFMPAPKNKPPRKLRPSIVPDVAACLREYQPASAKFIAEVLNKNHATVAGALRRRSNLFCVAGRTRGPFPKLLWRMVDAQPPAGQGGRVTR